MPFCETCHINVLSKAWIGHLRSKAHKENNINTVENYDENIQIVSSAFRNRIATYRVIANERDLGSLDAFFCSIRSKLKTLLNKCLGKHVCFKINLEFFAKFILFKNNTEELKSFLTKNVVLYKNYNFDQYFSEVLTTIKDKIESFEHRDSGWSFLHNSHLEININKYEPLRGSSYIDLPAKIKSRKACLNIVNKDDYCFMWSVTAALYPAKSHPERVSSYPDFRKVFNTDNMQFPVTFTDIQTFERNNPKLAFIVFGLKNHNVVGPLYRSDEISHKRVIHLLLLERNSGEQHYCLIKSLPKLVRSQLTRHHGKLLFCDTCLVFFKKSEELENHTCSGVVTVIPEKGSVIQFKHFERKQNVPFVIYADFESLLEKQYSKSESSSTSTSHHHVPAAFAYYIVCCFDENLNRYVSYRGPDCVDKFIERLYEDMNTIHGILNRNVSIIFTDKNEMDFKKATCCHICGHFMFLDKVRDHCHITGRYRGAAHSICNLQFKRPSFVPIFFHNLAGYDCHLFIKKLGEAPGPIKIIAKTKENYVSFTKIISVSDNALIQLRFVDSLKFLGASLDQLAQTLHKNCFKHLRAFFPNDSKFQLLCRKGIYPYEYMDGWARYEERWLPSITCFFSSLTNEHISNNDYEHAKSVWAEFQLHDLGEYTDLYLKTDVLLLADVFENFRKTCKKHYNLDPAFYLTAPSLSFDAMLLKTGVQLELINDLSMLRMIQKGIRGGICMCSHRHAKANNKYTANYDSSKVDSFIVYADVNNLYGYSMCQFLPLSDFSYLSKSELDTFDVTQVPDDSKYGYILEVDLDYPRKLHKDHNDLPFCAEKCISPGAKTEKLVPNLYDKYNYVIHYVHLKTCLKHGLVLRKIHRVIKFIQAPYLKIYIDLNTQLRQQASSTFEQDFFKLLNNSIFGKTLENTENRVNVKLVNEWNDCKNITKKKSTATTLIAGPNFHSASVFTDNLVAIQLTPNRVVLDKPIYIGFTVLELSKSHMYDLHYSLFRRVYGDRLKMCYTDTDSFIYHIETTDFYKDLLQSFISFFDTSNYPTNNIHSLPLINKKVPGLFKDEMGGKIITEFVGLRSKLYCVKTADSSEIKRAKGIKTSVVKDLNLSDYSSTLYQNCVVKKSYSSFKSIKHEIYTQKINKVALSSNDDKRCVSNDRVTTKAWGNSSILFG